MKMLLVGMNFYNYEVLIKEEFERQGYCVDLVSDIPQNYTLLKKLLGNKWANKAAEMHQKKMLKKRENEKYDLVLVIVGRFLLRDVMTVLKEKCRGNIVLYLWDDVARVENFEEVKDIYDKIYSFDPVDTKKYGFLFLPLFYTNEYTSAWQDEKKYDIYSALSNHSDRLRIGRDISEQGIAQGRNILFFMNLGRYDYLRKLFNKKRKQPIRFVSKPIDKVENIKYMRKAKAILDIQHTTQVGLTIRTLEALACEIKLITTNSSIKEYDFYNPNNILVIDRNNPIVDWRFIDEPYVKLEQNIYNKYSLKTWTEVIATGKTCLYLREDIEKQN